MARTDKRQPLGPHAGKMLQDIITRTVVDSRQAMIPAEREHTRQLITALLDEWEGPTGQIAMDFLAPLREVQDQVPGLKPFLDRLDNAENATDWFASLIGAIVGAIGSVLQVGSIYYRGFMQDVQATFPTVPLSPNDAADAAERNIMTKQAAEKEAAKSGVGPQRFEWLYQLTGEPPGIVDMLRIWRRGDLDTATLEKMIAYSRVRTEWTKYVLELSTEVPSGADIVEGYIKGQIPLEEAIQRWYEAGGRKQDFDLAQRTAGEAIGVQSAGRLFNHGLISEQEYSDVVRYSRINPRFERIAELERFQFLPVFQILRALTAGEVDARDAARWMVQDGYPADQVAALVKGATATKSGKARTLTESMILDTYEAGLMSKEHALTELQAIGYHADVAAITLETYDARKILSLKQQGVTATRRAFIDGKIGTGTASTDLDALGIDAVVRDHYLAVWAIERKVESKTLTQAQVGTMLKDGIITAKYAVRRWVAMGYSPADATLLTYLHGEPTPDDKPVE